MQKLIGRIEKDMSFVRSYRYPRLIDPYRVQLELVRRNIHQSQEMAKSSPGERVGELESACENLSTEITRIEFNLKKLEVVEQILVNATRFLKTTAIFISIVVLLGLFVVPTAVNTLNLIGPEASASSNVWYYQRTVLIIGIFVSVGISLFLTIRNILYED